MNMLSNTNHIQSRNPKMSFEETNSGLNPIKQPSNPNNDDHHLPDINLSHSNHGDTCSRASG